MNEGQPMKAICQTAFVLLALTALPQFLLAGPHPKPDPSMNLEMVGEGTISTSQDEFGAMPDKDWTTLYFNRSIPAHYHYVMYVSYNRDGKWTTPEVLPFSGEYRDSDPVIS